MYSVCVNVSMYVEDTILVFIWQHLWNLLKNDLR